MNDSERDGTGTNFKIGLLQHSLNGTSNFQEWSECLVAGIEKQFGSKVANPFQNGSEPNFTMMKAPTNATSAKKKGHQESERRDLEGCQAISKRCGQSSRRSFAHDVQGLIGKNQEA